MTSYVNTVANNHLTFKHSVDIYLEVIRLASLLKCDFKFPPPNRPYVYLAEHPELELIALLVVSTKLSYPFDEVERLPETAAEPAATVIDWKTWNETNLEVNGINQTPAQLSSPHINSVQKQEKLLSITERDVMRMKDDELDEYMDWVQETWITEKPTTAGRDADLWKAMYELFPVDQAPRDERAFAGVDKDPSVAMLERIHTVQGALVTKNPNLQGPKPGSDYKQYQTVEQIPQVALPFFNCAARMVGITVDILLGAIQRIEKKMIRWERRQARRS